LRLVAGMLMKIKDILKGEFLQVLVLAVPFLVLIPLWDKFPHRVAIHWGLNGKPNGWADKTWGLLLPAFVNIGLAIMLAALPRFDSRMRSYSLETQISLRQVLKIFRLTLSSFMMAVGLLVDAVALGWKIDMLLTVDLAILVVFAVLGNYLPKLRPNRFAGIRTRWTLNSPEVWARTHRIYGRILLFGSLALIPLCLLLPSATSTLLVVGFILLTSFGSAIYSYWCHRSLPPGI
jgi:uncharacterized membrane protein